MDVLKEFEGLPWRNCNILYDNAPDKPFVSNEEIEKSYIFKNGPIELPIKLAPVRPPPARKKITQMSNKNTQPTAIKPGPDSSLQYSEHHECLQALQLMQSGYDPKKLTFKEKQYLIKYNQVRLNIITENDKYLAFVRSRWSSDVQEKCAFLTENALTKFKQIWQKQLDSVKNYPRFYVQSAMYPLIVDDIEDVQMSVLENVVDVEKTTSCSTIASILDKRPLLLCKQGLTNSYSHRKLPVSRDRIAIDIARQYCTDVVISSSGLKKILNNHGPDYNNEWDIPIVIKEEIILINNARQNKTVIYVDKPFPKRHPTSIAVKEKICKWTIKQLCARSKNSNLKPNDTDISSKDLDDVTQEVHDKNVIYNLWNIKLSDEKSELMKTRQKKDEYRLLIRCNIDGQEQMENGLFYPVTAVPKLEHQLEYGGSVPLLKEVCDQWTSLFFKPNSLLYRVRIDSANTCVEARDVCNVTKIVNEAINIHNFKPHSKLSVLYKLITELKTLKVGHYILRHTQKEGPFASLLKETEVNTNSPLIYDLHSSYADNNCECKQTNQMPWHAIDVNYILPAHLKRGRLPGTFIPTRKNNVKTGKGKKVMGKKKNAKKKKSHKKKNAKTVG